LILSYYARKSLKQKATLQSGNDFIEILLIVDDGGEVATIQIDGVFYHFERIRKETLLSECRVDGDPDYQPRTDADGYCYLLAPFCR